MNWKGAKKKAKVIVNLKERKTQKTMMKFPFQEFRIKRQIENNVYSWNSSVNAAVFYIIYNDWQLGDSGDPN